MDLITTVLLIQYGLIFSLAYFVMRLYRHVRVLELKPQPAVSGHEEPTVPKEGLELGMQIPQATYSSLNGVPLNMYDGRSKILLFTMNHCNACKETYGAIKTFITSHPDLRVTLFLYAQDAEEAAEMAKVNGLTDLQVVWADKALIDSFKVNRFPLAFYLSEEQTVINKSVTNYLHHFEEMIKQLPQAKPSALNKSA
ncbi:hypothetical protein [Paenibacillus sp. MDMC362]|uniref:hypothetical protein n=1 Tax=Paenibacillus sp. MDMC362 TaxID=2977365 RepID=UPI000DC2E6B5|nr:hypothetical protein [Paenibacillus sp. MDMC362]RAR43591.1 hypothetical protein DP091_13920 [Paenibacillus sp. MDMC362]